MPNPTPNHSVVDVLPIIEGQPTGRFWMSLLTVTWSVAFLDGFDLLAETAPATSRS